MGSRIVQVIQLFTFLDSRTQGLMITCNIFGYKIEAEIKNIENILEKYFKSSGHFNKDQECMKLGGLMVHKKAH